MSNSTVWVILSAVGAVGTAWFGYRLYRLHRAMAQNRPGYLMPQLRMTYDPTAVRDEARQAGFPLFTRFRVLLFGALTALWLVLLAVSRNAAPWLWLRNAMLTLATAAWLAAMAENLALTGGSRAAACCGRVKWGMGILWVAGMFVGLIAKGFAQF